MPGRMIPGGYEARKRQDAVRKASTLWRSILEPARRLLWPDDCGEKFGKKLIELAGVVRLWGAG
jgi:hypothetical protein